MATIWKFYVPIGDGNSMFHLEVLYIIFYKSIFHIYNLPCFSTATKSHRPHGQLFFLRLAAKRGAGTALQLAAAPYGINIAVKGWVFPMETEETVRKTMVFPTDFYGKILTGNHGISYEDHGAVPLKFLLSQPNDCEAGTTWQVNKLAAKIAKEIIRDHG